MFPDGFVTRTAMTNGTATDIAALLIDERALPNGVELLAFSIVDDQRCSADLNSAFEKAIGAGSTAEYLRVGAVVNTLLTFFGREEITLTIEGHVPDSGHRIYDKPLRFYPDQVAVYGG